MARAPRKAQIPKEPKAKLTFEDTTLSIRVKSSEIKNKLQKMLDHHGVAIVELDVKRDQKGTTLLEDLMELDPLLRQYNAVLAMDKEIRLKDKEKLYGLRDLTTTDRCGLRFPGMASGMVNVYSSDLQARVYDSKALHDLAAVLYKSDAVILPNRLRMQVPGVGGEENSHVDSNLGSDLRFGEERDYGMILAINDNRPFEYVKGSHTRAFVEELKRHSYFKYSEKKHFIQFHLEKRSTPDPLNLRQQWARCKLRSGDLIIWTTHMIHRVAPTIGKRAIWSMFISVERKKPDWDDIDGPYAVPGPNRTLSSPGKSKKGWRTYDNARFVCPFQKGPASVRDANLFTLLSNYQPMRWPSNKLCFYYMNQGIANIKFKPPYMRAIEESKYKTEPRLKERPVWPVGAGDSLRVPVDSISSRKLDQLHIPAAAWRLKNWAIDPTKLKRETQKLLGFFPPRLEPVYVLKGQFPKCGKRRKRYETSSGLQEHIRRKHEA